MNETYLHVQCDPGIAFELSEFFTFKVDGYQFTKEYKAGWWSGDIRLFNLGNRRIYYGLFHKIKLFCQDRGYEFTFSSDFADEEVAFDDVKTFLDGLNLPKALWPRDYQIKAFVKAIRKRRLVLESPTASGKSLIIYLLTRWYNKKTLIIVPRKGLAPQMSGDFAEYGYKDECHIIMEGSEKDSDKQITLALWQSIYKQPLEWFQQFDVVIGDEAHGFAAKSLIKIMQSLTNTKYRFGTTGTVDDAKVNRLTLEGLFGQIYKVTTTKELMDQGHVAQLTIKAVALKYPDKYCQMMSKASYDDEIKWLTENYRRNLFVSKLAKSLNGNTIVLFNYEEHGFKLFDMIKDQEHPTYFINGKTDVDEREVIRKIVDTHKRSTTVASVGTTSTGINIPNLHNMIFVHPSKGKIRNLQGIGRALRKSETKTSATLYDIADDLQWKKHKNFTLEHFLKRIDIYNAEKFNIKIYSVALKDEV